MRPAPESVTPPAPRAILHLAPPQPSPATCGFSNCRWPVYPTSRDFEASAATILLALLCGLICGLILNITIRCFLRCDGGGRARSLAPHRRHRQQEQELGDSNLIVARAVTYAPGMTRLAGTEAECSICLTEFVEGDRIGVLETCSHGFHVECIERWLSSNKSCPTCRSSLVIDRSGSSESEGGDHRRENADQRTTSGAESSSGLATTI